MLGFFSCEKDNLQNTDKLFGYWVNPTYSDNVEILNKDSTFNTINYGFSFLDNGKFIERKIAGWCGTPPVSYENYNGNWTLNDSIININVDYWGGKASYKWKIVSITDNILKIKILEQKNNN